MVPCGGQGAVQAEDDHDAYPAEEPVICTVLAMAAAALCFRAAAGCLVLLCLEQTPGPIKMVIGKTKMTTSVRHKSKPKGLYLRIIAKDSHEMSFAHVEVRHEKHRLAGYCLARPAIDLERMKFCGVRNG